MNGLLAWKHSWVSHLGPRSSCYLLGHTSFFSSLIDGTAYTNSDNLLTSRLRIEKHIINTDRMSEAMFSKVARWTGMQFWRTACRFTDHWIDLESLILQLYKGHNVRMIE